VFGGPPPASHLFSLSFAQPNFPLLLRGHPHSGLTGGGTLFPMKLSLLGHSTPFCTPLLRFRSVFIRSRRQRPKKWPPPPTPQGWILLHPSSSHNLFRLGLFFLSVYSAFLPSNTTNLLSGVQRRAGHPVLFSFLDTSSVSSGLAPPSFPRVLTLSFGGIGFEGWEADRGWMNAPWSSLSLFLRRNPLILVEKGGSSVFFSPPPPPSFFFPLLSYLKRVPQMGDNLPK